ncbi:hypothetical protein L208DRAFT_1255352, partial [Tricholoma matsutake]
DVVHIDDEPSFVYHVLEEIIHHCLECCHRGTIGHPKKHDKQFEGSLTCGKCGLPLISFPNLYIIVSPSQIQFCEDFGFSHLVNYF